MRDIIADRRRVHKRSDRSAGAVSLSSADRISFAPFAQANFGSSPAAVADTDGGCTWLDGCMGWALFNTITPPSNPQYAWGSCQGDPLDVWGLSGFVNSTSNHPGGANFAFDDGIVRFLKSRIAIQTYWSLGTRAGGEVISSDSY